MAATSVVSLTDVRTHLRYPNPTQPSPEDAALQRFIDATTEVIDFECDSILPQRFDEYYNGGDYSLWLRNRPIISVENVEEGWGWTNYELDFVQVNSGTATTMFSYSIDNYESGEITRRSGGNVNIPFIPGVDNVRVEYTAGRSKIPASITLAVLELIAHMWQNSQLRSVAMAGTNISYDAAAGAVYTRDTESGNQNLNISVPLRILLLIRGYRHDPIIG